MTPTPQGYLAWCLANAFIEGGLSALCSTRKRDDTEPLVDIPPEERDALLCTLHPQFLAQAQDMLRVLKKEFSV